ncbi:unnamed protein product [Penicillium salamii]|uniref:Uncharacterized protein n=1 Tax=Penicillium salamii TaxID=1612424 RepID=A0A9W4INJ1_9EURO|nr:unnamed protein product [Penicillium salamii]CAG8121951.1 unnamed protein product [Penicillium salamii]CAG8289524.1 unnamed protein product [Penicillium salamii]CAG8341984.1 unnamed protein product [Penicillium salamii]CAG8343768.1 unnamed protein product [Penicillium salamii]
MADEKKQNPFEALGSSEAEVEHPPAYTAETSTRSIEPSIQTGPFGPPPGQFGSSPGQFGPPPGQFAPSPGPFAAPLGTPPSKRPIAIPAIASPSDSPFIRAYPPILQSHNLPKESFLNFLDQLNKDIASSPPLQVLDATGGILNSVPILFPLHWIGSAVSGLANLGSQGMSKSRTDSSLKTANRDIFGPRGLKVEVAKLDALAHLANIPILDSQGKISRQSPLFLQLQDEPVEATDERHELELELQRKIRTLQPWIADLEIEVVPWSSKSKLTRFNAALKKRNDPKEYERRGRRERRERRGRDGSDNTEVSPDDQESFRKALWLVIREIGPEERR